MTSGQPDRSGLVAGRPGRWRWSSVAGATLLGATGAAAVFAPEAQSQQAAPRSRALSACVRNDGERLMRLVGAKEACGDHETLVHLAPAGAVAGGGGGVAGLEQVQQVQTGSRQNKVVTANCPPGKKVVGGGFEVLSHEGDQIRIAVDFNRADFSLGSWVVGAHQAGGVANGSWNLTTYALCATPAPTAR